MISSDRPPACSPSIVVLPAILEAANGLSPRQALSTDALRSLCAALTASGAARTAETGAGASTAVFSRLADQHWAFTNDPASAARLAASPLVRPDTVRFVLGPSQRTLPHPDLPDILDAVLLDGPHAYPFPQLEYFHFYPRIRPGGWLILDDLQIRAVAQLARFLRGDPMFRLELRTGRTAFFRRTEAPTFNPDGDGWEHQRCRQRALLAWPSWSQWSSSPIGALRRRFAKLSSEARVSIRPPLEPVGGQAIIEGRARLPSDADLWLLARREGQGGWWPQGGDRILVDSGGRWRTPVRLGEPADSGARFDVLAAVVGPLTTARWRCWIERAAAEPDLEPVQLPPGEYLLAKQRLRVSRR